MSTRLGASVVLFACHVAAQMQWLPAGPAANLSVGVWAYDEARDRVVSYGFTGPSTSNIYEFDGQQWLLSPIAPPQVGAVNMAYDAGRRRIVMFAGSPTPATWEWDGRRWREFAGSSPSSRGAVLVYHETRGTVMMFGGVVIAAGSGNEHWEWDGLAWRRLVAANMPPARDALGREMGYSTLAYDSERDALIVFGATGRGNGISPTVTYARTWEWYQTNGWVEVSAGGPSAAARVLSYDKSRRAQVLCTLGVGHWVTWERTGGGQWTQVDAMHGGSGHVFDSRRGRMLTVGLQQLQWYEPIAPARFEAIGPGCPGALGTPTLGLTAPWTGAWTGDTLSIRAGSLPLSSGLMLLGFSDAQALGVSLPADLAPLGMSGCLLRTSFDLVWPLTGTFGTATWTLGIPDDATLRGARFFLQALVADPWVGNAAAATLSDAVAVTIGWR